MTDNRKPKECPSADRIRSLLEYDCLTGSFSWKPRGDRCNMRPGAIAGTRQKSGYIIISVDDKKYLAHRLAWKYVYGEDAPNQVDHINNDPSDNRICNLRAATPSQNHANKRRRPCAKYPKGVSLANNRGSVAYVAHVGINGRQIHVGTFGTVEEASAAYFAKAQEIHGDFANAG